MSILPPKPCGHCPYKSLDNPYEFIEPSLITIATELQLRQRIKDYREIIQNLVDPMECAEIVEMVQNPEDWDRAMRLYAERKLSELRDL